MVLRKRKQERKSNKKQKKKKKKPEIKTICLFSEIAEHKINVHTSN